MAGAAMEDTDPTADTGMVDTGMDVQLIQSQRLMLKLRLSQDTSGHTLQL